MPDLCEGPWKWPTVGMLVMKHRHGINRKRERSHWGDADVRQFHFCVEIRLLHNLSSVLSGAVQHGNRYHLPLVLEDHFIVRLMNNLVS